MAADLAALRKVIVPFLRPAAGVPGFWPTARRRATTVEIQRAFN
jgi:hypothetical protein